MPGRPWRRYGIILRNKAVVCTQRRIEKVKLLYSGLLTVSSEWVIKLEFLALNILSDIRESCRKLYSGSFLFVLNFSNSEDVVILQ